MTEFYCINGHKLSSVTVDGYTIGHHTDHLSEKDLEGLTFVIHSSDDGEVSATDIELQDENNAEYLVKFTRPFQEIASAINEGGDGVDFGLQCPKCDELESVRIVENGTVRGSYLRGDVTEFF